MKIVKKLAGLLECCVLRVSCCISLDACKPNYKLIDYKYKSGQNEDAVRLIN
jgi:hypothetical protein